MPPERDSILDLDIIDVVDYTSPTVPPGIIDRTPKIDRGIPVGEMPVAQVDMRDLGIPVEDMQLGQHETTKPIRRVKSSELGVPADQMDAASISELSIEALMQADARKIVALL